jgi:hypothetical protein
MELGASDCLIASFILELDLFGDARRNAATSKQLLCCCSGARWII